MLVWLVYTLVTYLVALLCYLTNPIVVLFSNEDGELPSFLHYWQTWDDSLDSEFFMTKCVFKCLDYGYYEHYTPYRDTDKWTAKYDKFRYFSIHKDGAKWTTKQRLQRYICRVAWLYRNNAYGFRMFFFGKDMTNIKWHLQENNHFYGTVGNILTEPFVYKDERRICSWLKAKVYIGWKTYPNIDNPKRCMLANRLFVGFGGDK